MTLRLLPNQSAPEETVNRLLLGRLTLTLTGDVTLDDVQAGHRFLDFQGTPSTAVAVTVPNTPKEWIVRNTSGQTVTVKLSASTGVAVDSGTKAHLYTDGVEVYLLAQAGTPQPPAAIQAYRAVAALLTPVASWPFGETTGSIADDSTADNDGTINGSVTVGATDSPIHLSGNKVFSFAGGNGNVQVPADPAIANLFAAGGSVSAWMNPASLGGSNGGRTLEKRTSGNSDGWSVSFNTQTGANFDVQLTCDHSGGVGAWRTSNGIAPNVSSHLGVTYDATSTANDAAFYINGQSEPSSEIVAPSGTPDDDTAVPLNIGNRAALDRGFDGAMGEIYLYKSI